MSKTVKDGGGYMVAVAKVSSELEVKGRDAQ